MPSPCPLGPLQFPKLYEAESIRLVHHSLEAAEQLCDGILAHFRRHFVQVHWCLRACCCCPQLRVGSSLARRCTISALPCCCRHCFYQGEELVGTREDGGAAACVVREVQLPAAPGGGAGENGAAGGDGGGDDEATEDEDGGKEEGEGAAEQAVDPEAITYVVEWLEGGAPTGQRASLRPSQLARPAGTPLEALTQPLLQQWVETVATAEPVAVR